MARWESIGRNDPISDFPGILQLTRDMFAAAAIYDPRISGLIGYCEMKSIAVWIRMDTLLDFIEKGPDRIFLAIDEREVANDALNAGKFSWTVMKKADLPDSWDVSVEEWLMGRV